jgi:hypothetical protein
MADTSQSAASGDDVVEVTPTKKRRKKNSYFRGAKPSANDWFGARTPSPKRPGRDGRFQIKNLFGGDPASAIRSPASSDQLGGTARQAGGLAETKASPDGSLELKLSPGGEPRSPTDDLNPTEMAVLVCGPILLSSFVQFCQNYSCGLCDSCTACIPSGQTTAICQQCPTRS